MRYDTPIFTENRKEIEKAAEDIVKLMYLDVPVPHEDLTNIIRSLLTGKWGNIKPWPSNMIDSVTADSFAELLFSRRVEVLHILVGLVNNLTKGGENNHKPH